MIMHKNGFCEENEMIEVKQACPLNMSSNFSTKITLIFHYQFYYLIPTTNRTITVASSSGSKKREKRGDTKMEGWGEKLSTLAKSQMENINKDCTKQRGRKNDNIGSKQ